MDWVSCSGCSTGQRNNPTQHELPQYFPTMGKASSGVIKRQSLLITALLTTSHKAVASPPRQTFSLADQVLQWGCSEIGSSLTQKGKDLWYLICILQTTSWQHGQPKTSSITCTANVNTGGFPLHCMAPTLKHLCCYNQDKRKKELLKKGFAMVKKYVRNHRFVSQGVPPGTLRGQTHL